MNTMAYAGLDPTIFALLAWHSKQLS